MSERLVLFTTWLTANPVRIRMIVFTLMLALIIAAFVLPDTIAQAGPAGGGGR